ncbi:MAG: phosphate signaling complex protein PhoU [Planctomycetes bacterium]|nr:phosphate signaling complex protein PhoU [Planctomycetota bacterium]
MTIHFQREVEKLKDKLLHLCGMVEDSLRKAAVAFERGDSKLAREVIDADQQIDLAEMDIEEECLKILALHQPVAIDLRFIVAALKMNNDLERVGDLATNIAERAISCRDEECGDVPEEILEMVRLTQEMLKQSIDALINMDGDLARRVCDADDRVDELNRRVYEIIRAEIGSGNRLPPGRLNVLAVSRHLERIADHATNIAEDVIYMVRGKIARHPSATGANNPS